MGEDPGIEGDAKGTELGGTCIEQLLDIDVAVVLGAQRHRGRGLADVQAARIGVCVDCDRLEPELVCCANDAASCTANSRNAVV